MTLLHRILNLPARVLYLALFLVATGLLGFGLYLQHGLGLEPCPMCIMQRYAFATAALIALIAGLHAPGRGGERIYAVLIGAAALTGGMIAARQSWMQLNPPLIPECGPGLEFMLESFPLAQALALRRCRRLAVCLQAQALGRLQVLPQRCGALPFLDRDACIVHGGGLCPA